MEMKYKKDMYNNYMICREIKPMEENYYGLHMAINNKIDGILNMELRIIDNVKYYYYNITSKQQVLLVGEKGQLKKEQVVKIMKGILNSLKKAAEYLLSEDDFLISPEYVYLDLSTYHIFLCYIPYYKKDICQQLSQFIEYLMDKIDYSEESAVLFTYRLYKISKDTDCTFDKLNEVILEEKEKMTMDAEEKDEEKEEEKEDKDIRMDKTTHSMDSDFFMKERVDTQEEILVYSVQTIIFIIVSIIILVMMGMVAWRSGFFLNPVSQTWNVKKLIIVILISGGMEVFFLLEILSDKYKIPKIVNKSEFYSLDEVDVGEETMFEVFSENLNTDINKTGHIGSQIKAVEDQGEQTMILGDESSLDGYWLMSLDSEEYQNICISEFPFFVGNLKKQVDSVIHSNKVSRYHAKLEEREGLYYVTDLNSTNGTFVNKIQLESNQSFEIKNNDVITFANVSYCFVKN